MNLIVGRIKRCLIVLSMLVAASWPCYGQSEIDAKTITVVVGKYAPFSMLKDGEYCGINPDLLRQVFLNQGFKVNFQHASYKRMLELVYRSQSLVGVGPDFFLKGKYTDKIVLPFHTLKYRLGVAYKKKRFKAKLGIQSFQDFEKARGLTIDILSEEFMYQRLQQFGVIPTVTSNIENRFKKFMLDRSDLFLSPETTLIWMARKYDVDLDTLHHDTFQIGQIGLLFNRDDPNYDLLSEAVKRGFTELLEKKQYLDILAPYYMQGFDFRKILPGAAQFETR